MACHGPIELIIFLIKIPIARKSDLGQTKASKQFFHRCPAAIGRASATHYGLPSTGSVSLPERLAGRLARSIRAPTDSPTRGCCDRSAVDTYTSVRHCQSLPAHLSPCAWSTDAPREARPNFGQSSVFISFWVDQGRRILHICSATHSRKARCDWLRHCMATDRDFRKHDEGIVDRRDHDPQFFSQMNPAD